MIMPMWIWELYWRVKRMFVTPRFEPKDYSVTIVFTKEDLDGSD